jgi:hypothetical protein
VSLLNCTLVHHTGTIIRFRPSQLPDLPADDADVMLRLPHGQFVTGHFRRNRANPNISGAGIVTYIKNQLEFGTTQGALIDVSSAELWELYRLGPVLRVARRAGVDEAAVEEGTVNAADLARLLALADRHNNSNRRISVYRRLLRPRALRHIMVRVMGAECQVEDCDAGRVMTMRARSTAAAAAILDVHHIEPLAKSVDHHPRNLCVLCANHHRLFHNHGMWRVQHIEDNVTLSQRDVEFVIIRDLSGLGE